MPSIFQNLETKVATAAKQDTAQTTAAAQLTALNLLHADLATQATSGKQDTGNTSLASIDAKTPSLVSGAVPVSLPAGQIATLTPPAAITGYATETTTAAQLALDTAGVRGIRRDADTSPVTDGQSHTLTTNAAGRLKVSSWPGAYALNTGTITSASSVVSVDVSRVSNATVELVGTFTGVNVTFESSLDGTNWKVEQGLRSSGAAIESASGVIATGVAYSWEFSVNGKNFFRVRATAWASGTATVNIAFGAYATEPFVSTPTHSVQQSGLWNVGLVPPTATAGTLSAYLNANTIATAVVKGSAGRLVGYRIHNPNATTAYLQAFNAATTGAVTLGTTVPIEVFPIPAGATLDGSVDFSFNYSAGIVIAATTTATGNTAVTTGLITSLRYV